MTTRKRPNTLRTPPTAATLGDVEHPESNPLENMTEEEIREHLKARGLGLTKARRKRSAMDTSDSNGATMRINATIAADVRIATRNAGTEFRLKDADIVEQALRMWLNANNIRV